MLTVWQTERTFAAAAKAKAKAKDDYSLGPGLLGYIYRNDAVLPQHIGGPVMLYTWVEYGFLSTFLFVLAVGLYATCRLHHVEDRDERRRLQAETDTLLAIVVKSPPSESTSPSESVLSSHP